MFITFEGPEGSGKTTQIQQLAIYLRSRGYPVYQTREPGGTPIGDQIRTVLHSLENTAMHPHAEALLYAASRAQLVAQEIRPRLAGGEIVLCDRYVDSSLAYQGYGHGLPLALLQSIQDFATQGLRPDLSFYLDLPVEAGIQRRRQAADQGEDWNRMDALALEFHQRVQAGYQALIAAQPQRWQVLNADQPIAHLQAQLQALVEERLKERR